MTRYSLIFVCALGLVVGCNSQLVGTLDDPPAPLLISMSVVAENELTLTVPDDIVFECDQSSNDSALNRWLGIASVASDCDGAGVLNDFAGLSDDCGATGSTTVTWTATDDCGNTIVQSATFTVADSTPPVFESPRDVTVDCEGEATESAIERWLQSGNATDACSDVDLTVDTLQLSDGCAGVGTTRATWTAVDACGNTESHTATLTVNGTSPVLVVIPPADVSVECDGAGNESALDRWLAAASTEGGCGGGSIDHAVTRENEPCTGASNAQVTWTATDECDASAEASAVFSIEDTTAPIVTGPDDLQLECGAPDNRSAIDEWVSSATGTDLCSGVDISDDFARLTSTCGAAGSADVTWTATDQCGNTASASAELDVLDSTAPRLSVPEDRRFCTGDSDLSDLDRWLMAAESEDACGEVVVDNDFSRDRVAEDCTIEVTWTATDECDNSTTQSARAGIQDSEAPTIVVIGEAELTLECNVDPYEELGASAVDSCDVELTRAEVGGDTVDTGLPGSYVVNYDAADLCGNEAEPGTRTVEVVDTLPPFVPEGIALELWPPNHQYVRLSLADCVRDLCETDLDVDAVGQIINIYSDEPENANGDGNTVADIVLIDNSTFMLRAERRGGSNGRVYGVTFDIADSAGNATRDTCRIAVPHDQSGSPAIDDGPGPGYTVEP